VRSASRSAPLSVRTASRACTSTGGTTTLATIWCERMSRRPHSMSMGAEIGELCTALIIVRLAERVAAKACKQSGWTASRK